MHVKMGGTLGILTGKLEGRGSLKGPVHGRNDTITIHQKEKGRQSAHWFELAEENVRRRSLGNTVTNPDSGIPDDLSDYQFLRIYRAPWSLVSSLAA
jgi:hypothetical protein